MRFAHGAVWAAVYLLATVGTPARPRITEPPAVSPRPYLWRVERYGRTSHLFGTIHVGVDAEAALGPEGREALDGARRVFVEMDMTSRDTVSEFTMGAMRRAEMPPDRRALEARAEQQLRRVECAGGDDDRAGANRVALTRAVDDLDAGRLTVLDQHALDGRIRTQLEGPARQRVCDVGVHRRLAGIRRAALDARAAARAVRVGVGVHGLELWVWDGSGDTPRLVADLRPGPLPSGPREARALGPLLLFSADVPATIAALRAAGFTAPDIKPGPTPYVELAFPDPDGNTILLIGPRPK